MSKRFDTTPHVDDPDLVDRLRLVEGETYCRGEEPRDANSSTGLSAKDSYARWRNMYDDPPLLKTTSTMIVIYGTGGWNRYFVCGDGSITFSKRHASEKAIGAAQAAGFRVE